MTVTAGGQPTLHSDCQIETMSEGKGSINGTGNHRELIDTQGPRSTKSVCEDPRKTSAGS